MKEETKLKKALIELTTHVILFEKRMDKIMKLPSDHARREEIAGAINDLSIANQSALHFELGYSLKKIKKLYSFDDSTMLIHEIMRTFEKIDKKIGK